jgi:hypothetical protein
VSDNSRDPRLIHVRKPVVTFDVEMVPSVPLEGPIHDGPLIHVRKPVQQFTATFGPFVRLFVPVANDTEAKAKFELLKVLVGHINEMEALQGRAGVQLIDNAPTVENGELVAAFVPNDVANGFEVCKRLAHLLWGAQVGSAVRVYEAEKPEAVYVIAA